MKDEDLAAERKRFSKVVAARKTNRELLELFEKLDGSDKFLLEAKPHLFGDLIDAATRRISGRQVMQLLEAIEASNAARQMRAVTAKDKADVLMRELVKKAFTSDPKDESCMMEAFVRLERSGVSADRGHTVALALESGMPPDDVGDICDLTFYAYYPCMRKLVDETRAAAAAA